MINRTSLRCSTCGTAATTRTAIGHGSYQEFAFPCPGCGIEIRFGMTLDQEQVSFEYTKIQNATWIDDEKPDDPVFTFDGENLVPLGTSPISPFVATAFLSMDPEQFMQHQAIRFSAQKECWPKLERLHTHYLRQQWAFFREELRSLGYSKVNCTTNPRRCEALIHATQSYGKFYSDPNSQGAEWIRSRLAEAEGRSARATTAVVEYFRVRDEHKLLNEEIHNLRKQWTVFIPLLLPLFHVYYWDPQKHSLDRYTIAQKRFAELKPFYVDCFETSCRLSSVAASIEGALALSEAAVPTRRGRMSIEEFQYLPNAAKIDLLKRLPVADLFVPFLDPSLRNGIGHNAARYIVANDSIEYVTQSPNGLKKGAVSYIRFCEKVLRAYGQLEVIAVYSDWLLQRTVRAK